MDSRLRGNDEENQSPGNHGFPPFPRVSPVIPAQVSPAIPAQVSPAILAGLPRHSRGSPPSFPRRRESIPVPRLWNNPFSASWPATWKIGGGEPRTWLSGNSDKQVNKRREWKSPGCWARLTLPNLRSLASYLMDSRLRGNDEENQSPGHHGFPRRCELHIIASYFEGLQRRAGWFAHW